MNKKLLTLGYVPYGTGHGAECFEQVFGDELELKPFTEPERIKDCDAIIVWGGADISPTIYNEEVGAHTHASAELSTRDKIEVAIMQQAIDAGVPIIGICRGAQLACALAGGKLIQHVNHHHGDHKILTMSGHSLTTSSVHHQMMAPDGTPFETIAVDARNKSDPEILYFPKIKALAIQGHPEFMSNDSEFVHYCMELTKQYLFGETSLA